MPWLARINPAIDWQSRQMRFAHKNVRHCIIDEPSTRKGVPLISAVQFVKELKKKEPAFVCVIKPVAAQIQVSPSWMCQACCVNSKTYKLTHLFLTPEMWITPLISFLAAPLKWAPFSGWPDRKSVV